VGKGRKVLIISRLVEGHVGRLRRNTSGRPPGLPGGNPKQVGGGIVHVGKVLRERSIQMNEDRRRGQGESARKFGRVVL